ncbi:MAG: hypothetical protein QXG03_04945 [Halalkalicoccus sp.]
MDSLSDHASRRASRGRSSGQDSGGTVAAINKALLLTGALLFVNGISISFIAVIIPFAISSAIVVTLVTTLSVGGLVAVLARRNPDRTRSFADAARPLVASVTDRDRDRARRQGGL